MFYNPKIKKQKMYVHEIESSKGVNVVVTQFHTIFFCILVDILELRI